MTVYSRYQCRDIDATEESLESSGATLRTVAALQSQRHIADGRADFLSVIGGRDEADRGVWRTWSRSRAFTGICLLSRTGLLCSPPVEAVCAGALAATKGKAHEPDGKDDRGRDPQEV